MSNLIPLQVIKVAAADDHQTTLLPSQKPNQDAVVLPPDATAYIGGQDDIPEARYGSALLHLLLRHRRVRAVSTLFTFRRYHPELV